MYIQCTLDIWIFGYLDNITTRICVNKQQSKLPLSQSANIKAPISLPHRPLRSINVDSVISPPSRKEGRVQDILPLLQKKGMLNQPISMYFLFLLLCLSVEMKYNRWLSH